MGCYLLCSDGMGRCMASFIYCLFFMGNGLVFYTTLYPKFGTESQSSALIEYGAYLFFWTLMVLSHMATMCVDPGFIEEGYQYDEVVLCYPFTSLQALESAHLNLRE